MPRTLACAVLSLLVLGGAAHAETIVLTPHVLDRTVSDGKQVARRIGDALRARFGSTVRRSETRTLRTIGEAMPCDTTTVRCLGRIASALRVDVIVSGSLLWQSPRVLILELFQRKGSARVSQIEEPVTGDVLGAHFDDWIAHLVRRLQGQREGCVVFWDEDPDLQRARIKLGGRNVALGEPMFVSEGTHELELERNGEVLKLGSVVIRDGRYLERGVLPSAKPKRVFSPEPESPETIIAIPSVICCRQAPRGMLLELEQSFREVVPINSNGRRVFYIGGMFETRARLESLIVGVESFLGAVYEFDRSTEQTTHGFGWSALLHAGVGTSLVRPIAASITLGFGGSGATGIVRPALELPVEARVEFPGRTWPMGYARATLAFSDQRDRGAGTPLFDELEAGVELRRSITSRLSLGFRLQYREALGQRFIGASLVIGARMSRRPTADRDGCLPREQHDNPDITSTASRTRGPGPACCRPSS